MTIKDIARIANVSVATVSRILNHKDQHISQETRERVLQVIKDCGYVPYAKLRDRLLSDNNTIGLAIPTLETWYHSSFVSHVQTLARQNGYALSLAVTGGTAQEELFALESFRSIKAEGVLLFPGSREGLRMLEQLHDEGCATVILDYMIENAVCPQVFRVNDRIAKRCAELLLENCQRIALVLRKECGKITGNSIRSGFEAALLEANRPVDPSLEVHVVPEFEQTFDALLESGVDGIVCQDAEIRSHFHPDAAGRGSEGWWIPADEYVTHRQTVQEITVCRKITIRRNKFPVLLGTGKNYGKKGKFRTSERKAAIWIIRKTSRLGQIWVKRSFGDGFDPNRRWINLGQLGRLFDKNSRIRNFYAANTAIFGGRSRGIRTPGLLDPNQARYQTSPYPDRPRYYNEISYDCQALGGILIRFAV